MKTIHSYLMICLAILPWLACDEVVQEELDKKKVTLTVPSNGLTTTLLTHTFLWQKVDKAEGYMLQLASPSFKEIQQMIVNEDLEETTYEFTLSPGKYEWRVKAYNNISETPYTTYSIIVDSSLDLSGSKVILKAPADEYATNKPVISFEWNGIAVANEYRLEIRTPNFNSGTQVIYPVITGLVTFTNTDEPFGEGTYAWAVSAENDFSKSGFSVPRTFIVDLTAPALPVLNYPSNNAIIPDSAFTFRWTRTDDNGSEITDSLYVYKDLNQVNTIRAIATESTSVPDSLGSGKYYWHVKSIDAAGNKSSFTSLISFTVQ